MNSLMARLGWAVTVVVASAATGCAPAEAPKAAAAEDEINHGYGDFNSRLESPIGTHGGRQVVARFALADGTKASVSAPKRITQVWLDLGFTPHADARALRIVPEGEKCEAPTETITFVGLDENAAKGFTQTFATIAFCDGGDLGQITFGPDSDPNDYTKNVTYYLSVDSRDAIRDNAMDTTSLVGDLVAETATMEYVDRTSAPLPLTRRDDVEAIINELSMDSTVHELDGIPRCPAEHSFTLFDEHGGEIGAIGYGCGEKVPELGDEGILVDKRSGVAYSAGFSFVERFLHVVDGARSAR